MLPGIPFYTTPQGRGVIPEDHPSFFGQARSLAFKEADLVLVVGTRLNYVSSYGLPPRFSTSARFVRIDVERGGDRDVRSRLALGIVGRCAHGARASCAQRGSALNADRYGPWRDRLGATERAKLPKHEAALATDQVPIHPLRLCKEIRDFIGRDTILVRRRTGDPQLRPPVDPELPSRPPAQLGAVRHDGRRAAVRHRRQGGEARTIRSSCCTATAPSG